MKKFFNFLISFGLVSIFFLPRIFDLEFHQMMLAFSLLPLLAVIQGLNWSRPTFAEIRHQKFRLTIYGFSVGCFLFCLLGGVGVLPFTRIDGGAAPLKKDLLMVLAGGMFVLMLVNLVMNFRDMNRREKGLPL